MTAEQIEAKKARVDEALRLHDEGLSITEISKRMGLRYETIRQYLISSGAHIPKPQDGRSKKKGSRTTKMPCGRVRCYSLVRMLYLDYVPVKEIAEISGTTPSAITHQVEREGCGRNHKRLRPEIVNDVLRRASNGESYYSIASCLGINHAYVSRIAIQHGIRRGKGGGCVARNNAARSSKAAPKRMARVRDAIGERFEVVRETRKDWFLLRCRECGHEFERFVDLHCKTECPECHKREVERRETERKTASMRRALVRAFRGVLRVKEREEREEREREFLDTVHVCKECGREFTLRELREDNPWNFSDNPTFCSLSCSHRYHGRAAKHRRRSKQRAGDCNMSLRELDERDNHTCYLCGGQTDWNDCRVDGSGNFVAGDMYPSMDHVIPLVAGGTHTHGNLRIAHRLCNALKGDRSVDEAREAIAARFEGVPS